MARPGISYEEVAMAAHELAGKGIEPTVEAVRGKLGTGSFSTIGPMLRRWKSSNADINDPLAVGLPPELIGVIKSLHERIGEDARAQCLLLQDEIDGVKKERQVLADTLAKFQSQSEADIRLRDSRIAGLEEDLATKDALVSNLQNQILLLQTQVSGLQAGYDDRGKRVEDMSRQINLLREQMSHFEESAAAQRMELARKADARLKEVIDDLSAARSSEGQARGLVSKLEAQAQDKDRQIADLKQSCTDLMASVKEAKSKAEEKASEMESLSKSFYDEQASRRALEAKIDVIQSSLFVVQNALESMTLDRDSWRNLALSYRNEEPGSPKSGAEKDGPQKD